MTVLEFLRARSDWQREAFERIQEAVAAYDVECIDTLIGDIVPPAELMKTQTDRKIAEELTATYQVQRTAQIERQTLERETAVANLQGEVVRSEQMVRISEKNALARAEVGKGEAAFIRAQAEAEAAAIRATGAAKAEAYKLGRESLGEAGFVATQMASILGENRVKLVPDIAVGGDGSGRLADVLIGRMLAGSLPSAEPPASK